MSDWAEENKFALKKSTQQIVVQTSKYTQAIKCAEPNCDIILVWNAAGAEDEDLEFRVKSCTCGETNYHTLCCLQHKNTFICRKCNPAK